VRCRERLGGLLKYYEREAGVEVGTAGHVWLSHISHTYKDACSLAQAKGLPSLIYHEPALEVRFMRGAEGTTRILTIRGQSRQLLVLRFGFTQDGNA
jgi:hypothetical protein